MSSPRHQPIKAPRSWKRRAARWLVVTLLGGVLTVVIWSVVAREWTRRIGERELAATVAATDQDDPAWRWEPLNAARPKPPDDRNSAPLIPRIKKLSDPEWGKELAKAEWMPLSEVPPNVRYTPQVLAVVRGELAASAEAVALARTLKDRPSGHRGIDLKPAVFDTLLQDEQDTRHAADLLRWDAVVAVEGGDTRRAADDLLAMLNASRSLGDEPFLICQLVRIAVRTVTVRALERYLAQVERPPDLTAFQTALDADAEEPLLLYGLRGERAVFDRLFENLDTGATTPDEAIDRGFRSTSARVGWWVYRGHLPADRAFALSWMNTVIGYARRPIHEQPALFATLPVPLKDPARLLSGLFLPAADKVAHASWRSTAEARCAVAGIACERFRLQHMRWPETLAELAPAFLPEVPLDPYDGQPLRYAKSETGVVVYSVGKRPPPQFEVKSAAPAPSGLPAGIDFGFRLWNPDQRGLPALEAEAREP